MEPTEDERNKIIANIRAERSKGKLKKFTNPSQKFSPTVFFSIILCILAVFLVSFLGHEISISMGFDILIISTVVRLLALFILFKIILSIFPIHDLKYLAIISFFTFIILISFQYVLGFIDLQKYQAGNILECVDLGILIIGSFGVIFMTGTKFYSAKHQKYYNKLFSVEYNTYKTEADYLVNNSEQVNITGNYYCIMETFMPFDTVKRFLLDANRFQNIENAEKAKFQIYGIPEEELIIVLGDHYILNKKESKELIQLIKQRFRVEIKNI